MRGLICLIFIALFSAFFNADANPLVLNPEIHKFDLKNHFTYFRDPTNQLKIDDVMSGPLYDAFLSRDGNLNFAISTDTIWLRLEIQRPIQAADDWWLELAPAYIGEATLYQVHSDSDGSVSRIASAGTAFPLSSREFKARHSMFKIHFSDREPLTIYLSLRSTSQLNVRGYLWEPAFYAEESASENLLLGMYYGVFVVILVLCMVRWCINGSSLDFWWLVYLVAEAFVILRTNGLASRYFFPESVRINSVIGITALSVMMWAGARFGIHAFELNRNEQSYFYHAASCVGTLALIAGVARLLDLEPASTIIAFSMAFILSLLNCVCSWRFLRSGKPGAWFYFSAIWFMTICVGLVVARNFGFIQNYQFIDYVWQSNLIIHAGLISFGMILTHRETENEKIKAVELQNVAKMNLKSSALQKRMVALVSHEFRNLLTVLSVSMHAINKRGDLPAEIAERHKNIGRIHYEMRRVIDNFLLEERIENADIKVSYRCTNVGELVKDVIRVAEMHADSHLISFSLAELPQDLWVDDGILRLILTNLLDNAVKYSAPGSRVFLDGKYGNGMLQMSVSDNGIGMNPESISRLFEPHFKADSNSEGMGIGLYMVRMMLHAHDGDMRVKSDVGSGSTLDFWLRVKMTEERPFQSTAAVRVGQ